MYKRVRRIFDRLKAYSYLTRNEIEKFEHFSDFFVDSLKGINARIEDGSLEPVDLAGFPGCVSFPGYNIRAGIFIGSFDPFQMTHLAMALRYMASSRCESQLLFVVPEGSYNPQKPKRSDYRYRFDLISRQIKGIFEPLIVPLDIGEGADTIEIVRRVIRLFPGSRLQLTHVLGSDTLPYALRLLPEDLAAWNAEAELHQVDFSLRYFVWKREKSEIVAAQTKAVRALGVPLVLDRHVLGTPSSSDFRERSAYTIIFPTEAVIKHLEILFRYEIGKAADKESELEYYL